MASIGFDKSTGWWHIKYFSGASGGRVKKPLCKHPTAWSKTRPPSSKRVPPEVRKLAEPFEELERQAKLGHTPVSADAPLEPYVNAYIETYDRTHRDNSTRCLRTVAAFFLDYCAGRKVKTMQAVNPAVCSDWLSERLKTHKPSSVRTERAYLSTIWSKARLRRVVRENPWEFAPLDARPQEADPTFWTTEELLKLIGVLDGWIRDWVILDVNTGLRVSALLGLRWGDVSFPDNRLSVPPHLSKGSRSYVVPLTPAANEVLARRWLESENTKAEAYIFANPSTKRPYLRGTVGDRIMHAVRRSGVRDFGHYCHSLRHSFAVALVSADVSVRVIQALLGHASIRTTEIYARLAPGKAESVMGNFSISPPAPIDPPSETGTSSTPAKPRP